MVTFGSKATREDIEKAGEGGGYENSIWNFRAGSTTVRFLEELGNKEWTSYWEHYDGLKRKFFPCPGKENDCPGCEAGNKAAKKYLVNLLVQSADDDKVKSGYVNLYKVPASLVSKAMRRVDRYDTICDRDYEIIRMGTGMDTEYDMETGDKGHVDIDKYVEQFTDHEVALQAAWESYAGKPEPKAAAKPVRVAEAEPEEAAETFRAKAERNAQRSAAAAQADDAGDPPSEPRSQSESAEPEADEEVLSEDAVRSMSIDQLHVLFQRTGLAVPEDATTAEALADHLIEKLGE
jgi:hypothetical protein